MAEWRVVADKIKIFPHPNADRMLLADVGGFQIVIGNDNGYENGDIVILAPKHSQLPDSIKGNYCNVDTGISYLTGPEQNRVKEVRLRGELSTAVTLDKNWVLQKGGWNSVEDIPLDTDLSEILGITKYEPPIPVHLAGTVRNFHITNSWSRHDVESFHINKNLFSLDEYVFCCEKIHGSMLKAGLVNNERFVTSKGFNSKQQVIEESETNSYWQAAKNTNLFEILQSYKDNGVGPQESSVNDIEVFGEIFPCQGINFSYGQTKPTLRIYRVLINNIDLSISEIGNQMPELFALWVPILYKGKFDEAKFLELSKGMEVVSGKSANIKEGIVVQPENPRKIKNGNLLMLKVINEAYAKKSTGDEIN